MIRGQLHHGAVESLTNGSRCAAVAGQRDVRMNQDSGFTEPAELSRRAASLSSTAQEHNTSETLCHKGLL